MSEQALDPTGEKILDGATRVLRDYGFKRATVELVAKYAGVSHMTIYRRWPSKNDLLQTAIISELTSLLDAAFDHAEEHGTSFAERSLGAFTEIVWRLQGQPFVVRELSTESGDQLPMSSSTSSAVMEVTVPLIGQRLERLAETTEVSTTSLDSAADVFVRLAYSLLTVKRPGKPLTTRTELAAYARECFGPYVQAIAQQATQQGAPDSDGAVIIELDQHRLARKRHRPHLQIAAASLVGLLAVGAGVTAVLGDSIKIPFIAPAGISQSTAPQTATETFSGTPPPVVSGQTPDGGAANTEQQLPAPVPMPAAPGSRGGPSAITPTVPPERIPQQDSSGRSAAPVGSGGGNQVDNTPAFRPAPLAPQPPGPGPQPPGPGPQPPGPGPQPPKPGPPPPGPGPAPQPPKPGPPPPGPGPAPQPPKPGPGPGPGPKPPGPGHPANQQPGPPN